MTVLWTVVDIHVKRPKVVITKSTKVDLLRTIFVRNGLPELLVSDNGPFLVMNLNNSIHNTWTPRAIHIYIQINSSFGEKGARRYAMETCKISVSIHKHTIFCHE